MPSADLIHPDRNCLWGARRKARRRSRAPTYCRRIVSIGKAVPTFPHDALDGPSHHPSKWKRPMQKSGSTIPTTGGGTGIGAALAHEFHAAGNQVIIAGRRQAALDAVVSDHPGMASLTIDMEDPAAIATF